jgi:hypothetical protein
MPQVTQITQAADSADKADAALTGKLRHSNPRRFGLPDVQ